MEILLKEAEHPNPLEDIGLEMDGGERETLTNDPVPLLTLRALPAAVPPTSRYHLRMPGAPKLYRASWNLSSELQTRTLAAS